MTAWNGIEPWPGNPVLYAWKRKVEKTMTDSLPEDMERAARILVQASVRLGRDRPTDPAYQSWRAVDLRMRAAEWRAEDEARQSIEAELVDTIGGMCPHGTARRILERFDVTPKPSTVMGPGPWEPDAGGSGAHDYSEGPPST